MQNIANKVVIITGASSGIGEATALKLAAEGAKLVLGARREDKLKAIAAHIKAGGGEAVYRVTDVTRPEDSAALVALAKSTFGKIDAIFLNAGLMPNSPLAALETANWNAMIDVNIKGVLHGVAAVLPDFTAQKSGHIITTSSVAGLKAYPGAAVYCGTKWAVKAIMEALRMESAQAGSNIRTATIYPAAVQSELVNRLGRLPPALRRLRNPRRARRRSRRLRPRPTGRHQHQRIHYRPDYTTLVKAHEYTNPHRLPARRHAERQERRQNGGHPPRPGRQRPAKRADVDTKRQHRL